MSDFAADNVPQHSGLSQVLDQEARRSHQVKVYRLIPKLNTMNLLRFYLIKKYIK